MILNWKEKIKMIWERHLKKKYLVIMISIKNLRKIQLLIEICKNKFQRMIIMAILN